MMLIVLQVLLLSHLSYSLLFSFNIGRFAVKKRLDTDRFYSVSNTASSFYDSEVEYDDDDEDEDDSAIPIGIKSNSNEYEINTLCRDISH